MLDFQGLKYSPHPDVDVFRNGYTFWVHEFTRTFEIALIFAHTECLECVEYVAKGHTAIAHYWWEHGDTCMRSAYTLHWKRMLARSVYKARGHFQFVHALA